MQCKVLRLAAITSFSFASYACIANTCSRRLAEQATLAIASRLADLGPLAPSQWTHR